MITYSYELLLFLSDLSPIIGYACHSLTDSLTNCCLVNLIDVTLACEDGNSKLVVIGPESDHWECLSLTD